MPELEITFYVLLILVAFLYSAVGHGGASGYLALMAFYSFSPEIARPTALVLNCVIALVASYFFIKSGNFSWKLFWPFALASIPAAYYGSLITLDPTYYKKILGALLIFPILKLSGIFKAKESEIQEQSIPLSLLIGAAIGLFSGMIGIGGGIILSPIILLLHWADMKQTAAVSALFILVNSLAGMVGQIKQGLVFSSEMFLMVSIALAGGLLGAYLGSKRLEIPFLKKLLALVLAIASVKLLSI